MQDNFYQRYLKRPKGQKRYYEFAADETCAVAVVDFLNNFSWFVVAFEAMTEDECNKFMRSIANIISLSS